MPPILRWIITGHNAARILAHRNISVCNEALSIPPLLRVLLHQQAQARRELHTSHVNTKKSFVNDRLIVQVRSFVHTT